MSFSRLSTHGETSIYAPIKVLETERLQTKHWVQRKTYLTCVECVFCMDTTTISKHIKKQATLIEVGFFFPFYCESKNELLKLSRRNKVELDVKCPALSRRYGTRACDAAIMR